jgi:preprotein translocase subunit SecE
MLEFLRQTKVELDLVKWPNRQETMKLTGLVISISLITGLYLGALDALFTNLFANLIK